MIYADYNATTPCLPTVADGVRAALVEHYGNPSNSGHPFGRQAAALREEARASLAHLIAARPDCLTFTSGATEALNLAIIGVMSRLLASRPRLLVVASEHEAVLRAAAHCGRHGADLVQIPVDGNGLVDLAALEAACDERCALVCAMLANNETGVINDIPAIARIAHASGALLCCDATQAIGKRPLAVDDLGCDFLACSGHKCYAPKGIGLLWKRAGLAIDPLLHGGGQERGLRAGTENLPGIHGFGLAAAWLADQGTDLHDHLLQLTDTLEGRLRHGLPGLQIFGQAATRIPGTTMVGHPAMGPGWLRQLSLVACSAGSSCASGEREPSHVLQAMGVERALAGNALRLSFGHQTTLAEVEQVADHLIATGQRLLASA